MQKAAALAYTAVLTLLFMARPAGYSVYGAGDAPAWELGKGTFEVMGVTPQFLMVKASATEKAFPIPLNGIQEILRQTPIGSLELQIDDSVMVRGVPSGENRLAVMVLIRRDHQDHNMPFRAGGFTMGMIAETSPVTFIPEEGGVFILDFPPHAHLFKEDRISPQSLQLGERVRVLGRRLLVLPREFEASTAAWRSFSGGLAASAPDALIRLPVPPSPGDYENQFDPRRMAATDLNPFGFFDPNMLRGNVTSWYGDYARIASELGAGWVSFGASFSFNWNLVQQFNPDGTPDVYRWERFDNLVRHTHANNLNIIGYIKSVPPGTVPGGGRSRMPHNMEAYKKFVTAVVERYSMDGVNDMPGLRWPIRYWSIEDEPMAPIYFDGDGRDYARLLAAAYAAAKVASPEAKIICSMLLRTGAMPRDRELGLRSFMTDFFSTLRDMGVSRPYDMMDMHWLGDTTGIAGSDQYELFRKWMDDINRTAREFGFEPVPFVNLEMGSAVDTRERHAYDLVKRHVVQLALGVQRLLWSGIRSAPVTFEASGEKNDYFRQVTLIDGGGNEKPAYFAYKQMTRFFKNAKPGGISQVRGKGGVYLFKIVREEGPAWIGWYDGDRDHHPIRLDVGEETEKVRLVEAVPALGEGGFFRQKTMDVNTRGSVELDLSAAPVYVLLHE